MIIPINILISFGKTNDGDIEEDMYISNHFPMPNRRFDEFRDHVSNSIVCSSAPYGHMAPGPSN